MTATDRLIKRFSRGLHFSPRLGTWGLWALCMLATPSMAGCDLAPPVERYAGTDLTRPLVRPFKDPAMTRKDARPSLDAAQLGQANDILNRFFEEQERVFGLAETDQHLDALEDFAIQTGRYFELVDAYRGAYDKNGASHFVSPRLAWAYVNLGQMNFAATIVDESLKVRPNDARLYFIRGFLLSRARQVDKALIGEVRSLWVRALELDPDLKRLYPVSARVLRGRIEEMNRVLGDTVKVPPPGSAPAKGAALTPPPGGAASAAGAGTGDVASPPSEASSAPADAGDIESQLLSAESSLASGQAKEAYPAFQRVLSVEPDNLRALYGRAVAGWKAIGQMDRPKALGLLDAVRQRPDLTGRQLFELGNIYYREVKQRDKALKLFNRLKEVDPSYAETVNVDALINAPQ